MANSATPNLSYAQPLFLEEQRASEVLGGFVHTMWTIAGVQVLACTIAVIVLGHRIPNSLIGMILGAAVLVVCVILLLTSFLGVTVVEPAEVQIRLSVRGVTVWKRTIGMSEILSAESTRFGDSKMVLQLLQGDVNFMTNKQCVRLRLRSFRNIVIGSQRPQELLDAVRGAIGATEPAPAQQR